MILNFGLVQTKFDYIAGYGGGDAYELSHLLGKRVDVLTPRALPERFRDLVLAEAAQL